MERMERIFRERGFKSADGAVVIENISGISGDDIDSLARLMPRWRQEKAMSFRHEERRRECVLSFVLLMWVLRGEYGITEPLEFCYGEHGKPSLQNCPTVFFSLSHCRSAVGCITGRVPVGIDTEQRGRYKKNVAQKTLNSNELAHVTSAADADLEFTKLWTRKEAVLKLTGQGIIDSMQNSLSIHPGILLSTFERNGYVCSTAVLKENALSTLEPAIQFPREYNPV